ncbi:hypothetical protein BYT27DRAFT_7117398 [Phlegmacium glaucopus]|nr:hypothetical protein BYT27DRAFT_7117398 [Phlegmacium glaucopus]
MASVPIVHRTFHVRNALVSYKNTCGDSAPRTTIKGQTQVTIGKTPKFKKVAATNDVDTGVLLFKMEGERILPGSWCSSCRNGGTTILCTLCQINSICTECIDFESEKDDPDPIPFECPSCFLKKNKFGEFPFKFRSTSSTRQNWPQVLATPLAIISIHLKGMNDTPSVVTYYHLLPWLQGNLVHVNLNFSFQSSDNDFESRLNTMLDRFEFGDLKEPYDPWCRFLIFITSHSDPNTGYIHIGPNNIGSVPIEELLNVVFSTCFQNILRCSDSNILSLLSCGALSTREDSKGAVKEFANRELFGKIICFDQPNFQTFFIHGFVMDLGLHHFIYNRTKLDNLLLDQQELGAHTNIVEFHPQNVSTFKWSHPGARPMGVGISKQCHRCGWLKTMNPTVSMDNLKVVLKCSQCKFMNTYDFPTGWKWVHGPAKRDEHGSWMVFVDSEENKNVIDTTW